MHIKLYLSYFSLKFHSQSNLYNVVLITKAIQSGSDKVCCVVT
eukprot:UN08683